LKNNFYIDTLLKSTCCKVGFYLLDKIVYNNTRNAILRDFKMLNRVWGWTVKFKEIWSMTCLIIVNVRKVRINEY